MGREKRMGKDKANGSNESVCLNGSYDRDKTGNHDFPHSVVVYRFRRSDRRRENRHGRGYDNISGYLWPGGNLCSPCRGIIWRKSDST